MIKNNIKLSVVIPVYNSYNTLSELRNRLEKVLLILVGTEYEIIFINDGSTDSSWEVLMGIVASSVRITAVNLTRNYGQHNALMCGFKLAKGEYAVTLDDDLQNPPEELSKLFLKVQQGYDVIYGIIENKKHSKFRNIGSEIIQLIYQKTFHVKNRITSFRIIKRDIIDRMLSYDKSFTFLDGIIAWYTTNIGNVFVEHHERKFGRSGYSLRRLLILAVNMMTNFSIIPAQMASLTGIIFAFAGFIIGLYMLYKKLIWGIPVAGFTSIIVIVSLLSGVQLLTIGILGEYISRVHINVSKKPQYSIREIRSQKDQALNHNECD